MIALTLKFDFSSSTMRTRKDGDEDKDKRKDKDKDKGKDKDKDKRIDNDGRKARTNSGDRTFIRNIRFIKPDPNAEDTEHTSIAQKVKEENEGRSKVRGSNPTDGPMTRSRSFWKSLPKKPST